MVKSKAIRTTIIGIKKYLIKIGDEIKVGSLTIELPSGEILNFSGKKGLVSIQTKTRPI